MQPTSNGPQGVLLTADMWQALIKSTEAIVYHTGAIRLMLDSVIMEGGSALSSLDIVHKFVRNTEEFANDQLAMVRDQQAIPLARLAKDLERQLPASRNRHPLEHLTPVTQDETPEA